MGDAPATLTLAQLRAMVRAAVSTNHASDVLSHTVDVLLDETCRQWPERYMAKLARRADAGRDVGPVLGSLAVIAARVREQIETRWGCEASNRAALDLVLRAVVVEFANVWFSSVETRIAVRRILFEVRHAGRPGD